MDDQYQELSGSEMESGKYFFKKLCIIVTILITAPLYLNFFIVYLDPDDFIVDDEGQPISKGKKKRHIKFNDS